MKEKQRQTWSLRQLFSAANFPVSRSNFRSSSGNVKETGGLRLWKVWTHLLYVGIWPVPSSPDNPFILRTLSRSLSPSFFLRQRNKHSNGLLNLAQGNLTVSIREQPSKEIGKDSHWWVDLQAINGFSLSVCTWLAVENKIMHRILIEMSLAWKPLNDVLLLCTKDNTWAAYIPTKKAKTHLNISFQLHFTAFINFPAVPLP